MQQNSIIFSMETEVLDSVSLSGRVEPVSLERRIHLPECVNCGRQVSLTAGTVFEHTRLPLLKWFAAILNQHKLNIVLYIFRVII